MSFGYTSSREGVITYGEVGSASGWLDNSSHTGLNEKSITIESHYVGKPWQTLANITTLTDFGYFFKDHRPKQTIYYRAIFAGDTEYEGSTSNVARTVVKVNVVARIKATSKYYQINGTVYPSKKNRFVKILSKKGSKGRWIILAGKRLNSKSQYEYNFDKEGRKGTYYIKAYYPGDKYNGRNNSKIKKVTIN